MRFYYFSLFSWMAYAVVVFVAVTLLWLIWTRLLKRKVGHPVYWVLVGAILVAPWAEELWIAYSFDRLCRKDAGILIKRTVEVDGFYDDTTHWWRQLVESNYRFVESRDRIDNKLWRVERNGNEIRHFQIDRPSARYQYKMLNSHTSVAHQIKRFEDVVIDSHNGEVLGRYTNYYRGSHWFFISLSAPTIPCEETETAVRQRGTLSIVALTLRPTKD